MEHNRDAFPIIILGISIGLWIASWMSIFWGPSGPFYAAYPVALFGIYLYAESRAKRREAQERANATEDRK